MVSSGEDIANGSSNMRCYMTEKMTCTRDMILSREIQVRNPLMTHDNLVKARKALQGAY